LKPCKDITIEPLAGGLDLRSESGSVDPGNYRLILNMSGDRAESWCRMNGWSRYGWDNDCVNNLDLHDQMIDGSGFYSQPYDYTSGARSNVLGTIYSLWYVAGAYGYGPLLEVSTLVPSETTEYCYPGLYYLGGQCHEAPTLLESVTSTTGKRRLVAATKSRIYAGDDKGGNWTILADGLGGPTTAEDCICSTKRFRMAQLGNTVLFTNGIDPVMAWEIGMAPSGCYYWTADFVTELQGIGVTNAKVIATWGGFVFAGNVLDSGSIRPSRLYWSDYNDPYSWVPDAESLAGYHDFGLGEKIQAMHPIGGRLLVYTDKAIYEVVQSTSTELVFAVNEMYRGPAIPKFPYAIINTGTTHVWLGDDDMWTMNDFDRSPQRVQWMRGASAAIYKGIKSEYLTDLPDGILSAYSPINKAKCDLASGWWNPLDQSLWFSWPTGSSVCPNLTLVIWTQTGKASLVDHGILAATVHRPDTSPTLRDFLGDYGLCDPSTLRSTKEGDPCPVDFTPVSYTGLVNSTENFSLGVKQGSLLSNFCNMSLDELCRACEAGERWLFVSASDKAIKEFTKANYSRQQLSTSEDVTFPAVGEATYTASSYPSLIQTDGMNFKSSTEKRVQAMSVEFTAEDQTVPGVLYAAVGAGSQPSCLDWETADGVDLECLDAPTDSQTRATKIPRYAFWVDGVNIAWRIWTNGTGNAFCLSGVTLKMQGATKCW